MEQSIHDEYAQLNAGHLPVQATSVAVNAVLGVPVGLAQLEKLEIRVLEVMVGVEMGSYTSGHDFKELDTYSHTDEVTESCHSRVLSVMKNMILWAMYPMTFENYNVGSREEKQKPQVGNWLRRDIFLHIQLHIDDEETLRVAVVEASQRAMLERAATTGLKILYAIIFSGYHIAIVRIERDAFADGASNITHTVALPFFPSWYATSPSTPGITALGRLSYLPDPDALARLARLAPKTEDAESNVDQSGEPLFTDTGILDVLPSEILVKIASYLPDLNARYTFARLSLRTKQASIDTLRGVYVNGWPMLDIPSAMHNVERRTQTYDRPAPSLSLHPKVRHSSCRWALVVCLDGRNQWRTH